MPRRPGMRDDDVMARLADLERRMDDVEQADKKPPAKADKGKE